MWGKRACIFWPRDSQVPKLLCAWDICQVSQFLWKFNLVNFWSIFGHFLVIFGHFLVIFWSFFGHFLVIFWFLVMFLVNFSAFLAPLFRSYLCSLEVMDQFWFLVDFDSNCSQLNVKNASLVFQIGRIHFIHCIVMIWLLLILALISSRSGFDHLIDPFHSPSLPWSTAGWNQFDFQLFNTQVRRSLGQKN